MATSTSTPNPILADKLEALAQRLHATAQDLRSGSISLETDANQRMGMIKAGAELVDAVSKPWDKILNWIPQFAQAAAVRLFIKWGVFQNIPTGNGESISYEDLAAKVGAEVSLITRFAWVLVSGDLLQQIGTDRVAHTQFSEMCATPSPMRAMVEMGFDNHFTSFMTMPKYFDQFGLKEPKDRLQTIFAFSEGQLGSTAWEIINKDKDRMTSFMLAMGAAEDIVPALGTYDLGWAVEEAAKSEDRALVVDVGGGKGQALKAILRDTPGLPRHRCVLEDLPEIIEENKQNDPELSGIQMVGMDFHSDQPVKGALVYYIRRCLHDYSDDECVGMLEKIADAMAADSRLLIAETLLSNPPAPVPACMDFVMATISGKERTVECFSDITGRAGLEITKVTRNPGGGAVVECAKA